MQDHGKYPPGFLLKKILDSQVKRELDAFQPLHCLTELGAKLKIKEQLKIQQNIEM